MTTRYFLSCLYLLVKPQQDPSRGPSVDLALVNVLIVTILISRGDILDKVLICEQV